MKLEKDKYYYTWDNKGIWWSVFQYVRDERIADPIRCVANYLTSEKTEVRELYAICYTGRNRSYREATPIEERWLNLSLTNGSKVEKPTSEVEENYQIF